MSIHIILMLLFFLFMPVLIIFLEGKYSIVKKAGSVLICYVLGAFVGNIGLLPEEAYKYQDLLSQLTVPLALPLILFSMDVRKWLKMAGSAISSLLLGLFTVVLMIFVGYWIFKDSIPEIWKVSGMLTGIYTGGTPNMAAMKSALNVETEVYLMTHTYEVALGAIYLVFIMSVGQRVFLLWLPPFKSPETGNLKADSTNLEDQYESYTGIFKKKTLLPVLGAVGLSVLIFGAGFGLSRLFPESFSTAAIILLITTFGIAFSFVPRIKNIEKTFQSGMYIILIFCLVVSSMADIRKLADISFNLFWYVGLAMFGSHILHAFLARFFKIDADTVIISGSALICSPPFVPVVAGALRNREVILTGLIVGIAGYAVGNYLGVIIAYALR
ncbi:MAG: DUF819 family protein [Bacteroidales bacterium]|nr:DUF819 family protein [Bacteroidales bacterium]